MKFIFCTIIVFLTIIVFGCQAPVSEPVPLVFEEIETPAGPEGRLPNLTTTPTGKVLLTWVEPAIDEQHILQFSERNSYGWTDPVTIAQGPDWFVNWADFPMLTAYGKDRLAAHFLAKTGEARYAYGVHVVQSGNGGRTWSEPRIPHTDGTASEHGFVSMLPWSDERLFLVWLDGRNFAPLEGEPTNEMTLRTATMDATGNLYDEALLDGRICDCCQTDAARTPNGAVVVYRDRTEDEIRDISIVRYIDGAWTKPKPVYTDGWEIAGCPVNGAAVASQNSRIAVAWFTGAGDVPRVKLAFSTDEGATFGQPVVIDDGQPVGRLDVLMLEDGSALVSWIVHVGDGAEIRLRRVSTDGTAYPAQTVAPISPERASGFPRMTRDADHLYIAWTEVGHPSRVRMVWAPLGDS
jgi:hypothetical protein